MNEFEMGCCCVKRRQSSILLIWVGMVSHPHFTCYEEAQAHNIVTRAKSSCTNVISYLNVLREVWKTALQNNTVVENNSSFASAISVSTLGLY